MNGATAAVVMVSGDVTAAPPVPSWVIVATAGAVALGAIALVAALRFYLQAYREQLAAGMRSELEQAFVFVPAALVLRLHLAGVLAFAGLAYLLTRDPLPVLAAVVIAGLLPRIARAWIAGQRRRRLVAQFPDAVMLVAGGLRSGNSLSQALAQATEQMPRPVSQEFGMAMREQRLGVSLDAAVSNLERRLGLQEATLFASAVRVAQGVGGNLAETLERLAATLRRKQELEGRIDALTAQGRLQGWVMVMLPLVIAAALLAIEPEAMRPLFSSWYGWVVCVVVVCLEGAGLFFIRKIVRIDV
jgi:tight adherence protein B